MPLWKRKFKEKLVALLKMKRYREWHIYNGHLLLMETRRDTTGARKTISTDTADIVVMRHDSLLLRFADHEQGYYRK